MVIIHVAQFDQSQHVATSRQPMRTFIYFSFSQYPIPMINIHLNFRFYSTLTKSEIRALYEKYRLDFELFGYKPDLFISFGMSDETTPAYDS